MRSKLNKKQKIMAYVLSTDDDLNFNKNITQKEIASLFAVSQSSISNSIKEIGYEKKIHMLEKELEQAKKELLEDSKVKKLMQ